MESLSNGVLIEVEDGNSDVEEDNDIELVDEDYIDTDYEHSDNDVDFDMHVDPNVEFGGVGQVEVGLNHEEPVVAPFTDDEEIGLSDEDIMRDTSDEEYDAIIKDAEDDELDSKLKGTKLPTTKSIVKKKLP